MSSLHRENEPCVYPGKKTLHTATASAEPWNKVPQTIFRKHVKVVSQTMTRRISGQITNDLVDHGS